MTIWCLLTADEDFQAFTPPPDFNNEWQTRLLYLSLDEVSDEGMHDLAYEDQIKDFCTDCRCIICFENVAVKFRLAHFHFGNLNPHALPNTIRSLRLFACKQHYPLYTRSLPKDLRGIGLRQNRIYGRLDLTTLPPLLQLANFRENELCGPIDLTKLPKDLQKLDLSSNSIRQHTVFYDSVPENLVIRLDGPNERRRIRNVVALNPNERRRDKRGFDLVTSKNMR
uniref:Uncharacterized protein n=1 Tax=Paramoeba aestuarina TaxID=180227 RepID=A0A7S4KS23_9EUKA|mmetsp:Transcript_24365/g.37944  ORF Transcript_24365/g.37944 Transcript_24365/m.37944 type:complete len:225 (+) Transcript_24365:29-703(+)